MPPSPDQRQFGGFKMGRRNSSPTSIADNRRNHQNRSRARCANASAPPPTWSASAAKLASAQSSAGQLLFVVEVDHSRVFAAQGFGFFGAARFPERLRAPTSLIFEYPPARRISSNVHHLAIGYRTIGTQENKTVLARICHRVKFANQIDPFDRGFSERDGRDRA